MSIASFPLRRRPGSPTLRLLRKGARREPAAPVVDRLVSLAAGLVLSQVAGVPFRSTPNFLPQSGEKGGPLIGI